MKPTHTPGPWKPRFLHADGLVIQREGWEISTPNYEVCGNILNGAPIRNEADARLIAAAPELLDAVRDYLEDLKGRGGTFTGERLTNLIAKAEGKS